MTDEFRPRNFVLCSICLSLAIFMQLLDTTIANVSLPTIAGNLGSSAQQSTWVITAFAVSNAIALPLTGWFARRLGEVRLFIASIALFAFASLLCGLSTNLNMLILFRALQGFAAGPIYPVTQALMIAIFPSNKRSQALVSITVVGVIAPVVGPILGGWITDSYSWPWIFFINIPIGVFVCYVVRSQMKNKPENTQRLKMDYVGLISLAIGIGALQIVFDKGNEEDWFDSNFIVIASIVAVFSLAVFIIWELTEKEPMVNLRIFRHRNFTFGALCAMLGFGAYFGGGVLIPLWLQTQLDYTPLWAGLAVAPGSLSSMLVAPLIGVYGAKLNLRLLASAALIVMAIPCFLRSTFNLEVDYAHIVYMQLLQGFGVTTFFMPMMIITLSDLKSSEISAGVGLSMFLRTLGGSFAVSLSNYLWNTRAILHHSQMTEQFSLGSANTVDSIRLIGQGNPQLAMAGLDRIITAQAYQISFNEVFFATSLLLLVVTSTIWLTKPPFSGKSAGVVSE